MVRGTCVVLTVGGPEIRTPGVCDYPLYMLPVFTVTAAAFASRWHMFS